MKNKTLTVTQLSELLALRGQSIYSRVKSGRLYRDENGLFPLSHPTNRAALKEAGINPAKIKIPAPRPAGRPIAGAKKPGEITSPARLSTPELREQNLKLQNAKLQIDIDYRHKVLLPTIFIDEFLLAHIEKMNSAIERTAATIIQDVGKKILEAGEINGAIIEEHTAAFLAITHDVKEQMRRAINAFDPEAHKIQRTKRGQ